MSNLASNSPVPEWITAVRGLGVLFAALLLLHQLMFRDPDFGDGPWTIWEICKVSLAVGLMLPWSKIGADSLWWLLYIGLVVLTANLLVRILIGLNFFMETGNSLESAIVILGTGGTILIIAALQVVAIWRLRYRHQQRQRVIIPFHS